MTRNKHWTEDPICDLRDLEIKKQPYDPQNDFFDLYHALEDKPKLLAKVQRIGNALHLLQVERHRLEETLKDVRAGIIALERLSDRASYRAYRN